MQETLVQFLGQEDPLEKEMATHSNNILAWRIPWTEEPGRLQSMRSQKVGHDLVTKSAPSLTMDWLHFPVVILIGTTSKKNFFLWRKAGCKSTKESNILLNNCRTIIPTQGLPDFKEDRSEINLEDTSLPTTPDSNRKESPDRTDLGKIRMSKVSTFYQDPQVLPTGDCGQVTELL